MGEEVVLGGVRFVKEEAEVEAVWVTDPDDVDVADPELVAVAVEVLEAGGMIMVQ